MTEKTAPKGLKLGLGAAALLICAIVIGAGLMKRASAPSVDSVFALLPRDASGFVILRGLPALALELGSGGGMFTDEVRAGLAEGELEALKTLEEAMNVDLRTAAGILDSGFDPMRPAAWSWTMIRAEPVGVLLLPASDADLFALNLSKYVEAEGSLTVERRSLGESELFVADGGELSWCPHDGYVIVAVAENEKLGPRLIEDTLEGRDVGVGEVPWVASMTPLIDSDWQILGAVDPDLPDDFLRELPRDIRRAIRKFDVRRMIRDVEGFAVAVDASSDSVRVKARITAEEGGDLRFDQTMGERRNTLGDRVPGTPLAGGRIAVDLGKTTEILADQKDVGEEWEDALREVRRETGVDLEDDVLAYIGSPISFAVFESERSAEVPLGFAAWVPLDKDHQLERAMEDLDDSLKDERVDVDRDTVGDATWRSIHEDDVTFGWGIAEKHLVLVFGKRLLADVSEALDKPRDSYLDAVGSAKDALEKEGDGAGWVDVDEVLRAMGPQLERDRDFREAKPFLSLVNEVLATTTASPTATDSVIELRSDEGFDKALAERWANELERRRLSASRARILGMVDAIRTAETAYHAEWDAYAPTPWTAEPGPDAGPAELTEIGWQADAAAPCRFRVELIESRHAWKRGYTASAECDADGDGVPATYAGTHKRSARPVTDSDIY